jgi:hypothetical protein
MIRMLATSAFTVALASTANAQMTMESVMPSFNFQFVEPTLQAANIPYQRMNIGAGFSVLEITINDVKFVAAPTACQNAMCAGFQMEKSIDGTFSADQMMTLNSRSQVIKAVQPRGSSKTFITRYLIGDYGYVRGSFLVNLAVFANAVKKIEGELAAGAGSSVSFDPSAAPLPDAPVAPGVKILGDDFADTLNARQKSVLVAGDAAELQAPTPTDPRSHELAPGAPHLSDEFVAGTVNNFD